MAKVNSMSSIFRLWGSWIKQQLVYRSKTLPLTSLTVKLHGQKKGPVYMRPERDTCISESVIQVRGERLCTCSLNSFKLSSSGEPCLSSAENPGPECVKSRQVGITGSHFTSSDWPLSYANSQRVLKHSFQNQCASGTPSYQYHSNYV